VSADLWAAVTEEHLASWNALVVLAADVDGLDRFEPLRTGKVGKMAISGEILTIEVSLAGYAAEGDYVWPGIAQAAKNLPIALSGDSAVTGHFLQELPSCPTNVIVDDSVDAWERAADAFFALDIKGYVPFLFMMEGGSEKAFGRYKKTGELVVESGGRLRWSVHTKCSPRTKGIKNPLGEVIFDVSCPPMRMVTSRRIRADSRRDVRQMRLASDAVFRTVPGHLSVRLITFEASSADVENASARNPVTLARYDVPVRAGYILPTIASLAAAIATVAAMLDRANWQDWANLLVAGGAGLLVFLSLRYGFRGGSGS